MLQNSRQFVESLLNLTPAILYIYDIVEKKNVYSNDGIMNVLGYSTQEIKDFGDELIVSLMHPDDFVKYVDNILSRYQQAADKEVIKHHYRMKHRDGSWKYLESSELIYERDGEGNPTQIFGLITDVTESRLFENALLESHTRYELVLEGSNAGIWDWDVKNKKVHFSPGWKKMRGYSPDEIGDSEEEWSQGIHPDDVQRVFASVERHFKGETDFFEEEYRVKCKNDSYIWILDRGKAIHGKNGAVARMAGSETDITDRKQTHKMLEHLATSFAHLSGQPFFEAVCCEASRLLAIDYIYVGMLNEVNNSITVLGGYALGSPMEVISYDLENTPCMDVTQKGMCIFPSSVKSLFPKDELLYTMGIEGYFGIPLLSKEGQAIGIMVGLHSKALSDTEMIEKIFSLFTDRVSAEMQRSQAEEALRESEEKYRSLFNGMTEGFALHQMIYDDEGNPVDYRFLDLNPAFEKLTGLKREVVSGKCLSEVIPGDDPKWVKMYGQVAMTGEPCHFENYSPVLQKHFEVFAYRPALDQFAVLFVDITERKIHEQELKESEERFKTLHNASFGGITIHDKGLILECNNGLSEMTGYSYHELIGMDGLLLISEDTRNIVVRNISNNYEKPYEAIGVRKNGERYPIRLEARNIPYKGRMVRVAEFRDITEVKNAEKEMRDLEDKLLQAQKMESIGRLAGGVAHDFNNMLGVIIGHSELALDKSEPCQPIREDLVEIKKAAERSANLTKQLLAFARKQTIAPKVVDINQTVEGMLLMLRRMIGEDIDMHWKPSSRPILVLVDPTQIDQILANLCVNARDAITGVGQVIIETESLVFDEQYCSMHAGVLPGKYAMIAVTDNGIGMDDETLRHLFEPFYTTKGTGQGTGLGLATVYGAVKQNNGFINVYSEKGHGTTFKIFLPEYKLERATEPSKTSSEVGTSGSETILIVEDEPSILRMATVMLTRFGYRVIGAKSPSEAISIVENNPGPIDLLISDVIMPEMNGRELATKLISIHPSMKILFMSGYTAEVIATRGVLEEGVEFIQKPFSVNELGTIIRQVLDR